LSPTFVLIHSPLVGPITWRLVADELHGRGVAAVTPSLHDARCSSGAYWQRHVNCVSSALRAVPAEQHLVLVGHSGAGPLLPAIGSAVTQPVAAYVFVDAALPGRDGQSRLDLFDANEAERFRAAATGGMIPTVWRNDEPLPVPSDWPDAPRGYLRFSAPYESDAQRAGSLGWQVREMAGGHFHMLVDPVAVTDALLDLVREVGV
jgi:hypothetical protein